MREHLVTAMFTYLRLKNGELDFNVNDPVPKNDPVYGVPNKNWHIVFDAARDDPMFSVQPHTMMDVVTDGNQPTARRLCADERAHV